MIVMMKMGKYETVRVLLGPVNFEFVTWIKMCNVVNCQPLAELSSDDMCVKATMALMIAMDKVETRSRLDSPDQAVDLLCWHPFNTGL